MNNNMLEQTIINIIQENFGVDVQKVEFEIPKNEEHGNLSTNVSLKNSKILKKNPQDVANVIKDSLSNDQNIDRIDVVAPGFINFYFSKKYFSNVLKDILENGYTFKKVDQNINVEFVSANPTGELHLGHARNAIFGDSLGNLLKKVGNNVIKEYYINDAGVQMQNLGKSIRTFYLQNFKDEPMFEEGYKGKEILAMGKALYDEYGDSLNPNDLDFFINYGYEKNMSEIRKVLKDINVEFDIYSKEKSYHDSKQVEQVVSSLVQKGEIYEEGGAKWLSTTKYGDDKDRVLEKSDGTHTYLTSDIAYHEDKFLRTHGKLINIWGADHHGYIKRVEASMESLGYNIDDLETIFIQMVSVLDNKEKVKMSKRAGTSVTIRDLLDVVDKDVLRYFFIMRSPDTQLDFDIGLAHEQNSQNPIFYIQYAHARICSILEKSDFDYSNAQITEELLEQQEVQIIYKLELYKKLLIEAADERRPHLLTNYVYDLATKFHKYYNSTQILTDDKKLKDNKILLCLGIKNTIKDCLEVLGIKAKEKM